MTPALLRSILVGSAVALAAAGAAAQTAAAAKPAAKAAAKKAAAPAPTLALPDAPPEQVKAADLVFYGHYECEFNQSVDIVQSLKHSAYVDVRHGKSAWLMKPVLSSTGAIRLEDVRAETLMVQISSKSMLLNVKTGRRLVDECVSPKQRELIEAAKAEKAAKEAAAAEAAAKPPADTASASSAAPAEATVVAAPASAASAPR